VNVFANSAVGYAYRNASDAAFRASSNDAGELSFPDFTHPENWGVGMWIAVAVGGYVVYRVGKRVLK
jgi:hypothetical protein